MDELQSQTEIVNLKNTCIQYEKRSIEELKKGNEDIKALEAKMNQVKEKNTALASDIEILNNEYRDLMQKREADTKEEALKAEQNKLEEMKRKHEGLLSQLNALKQRCDLMNDPGYLNSLVMYWTPQAMFKYTQAYNMQSKA